jgi:hypothetical protein
MNAKNIQQFQQEQQQTEQIPEELVQKFDGDRELVERFMANGYTTEQLAQSSITHPTYTDPVCTLTDGKVAGFWLDKDKK